MKFACTFAPHVLCFAILMTGSVSAFRTPTGHAFWTRKSAHTSVANRPSFARLAPGRPVLSHGSVRGGKQIKMVSYAIAQDVVPDPCPENGVALVYFSGYGDLRVHDHPGLEAAASASEVHAMFVFDAEQLAGMTDRQIRLLASSVDDLRNNLAEYAIPLQIGRGNTGTELKNAVQAKDITHLYVHSEPTAQARRVLRKAEDAASARSTQVVPWTVALRAGLKELTDDYSAYEALLGRAAISTRSVSASRDLLAARKDAAGTDTAEDEVDVGAVIAAARSATDPRIHDDVSKLGREMLVGDREEGGETAALELWERYKEEGAAAFAEGVLSVEEGGLEQIALGREGGVWAGLFSGEVFVRAFRELLALGCLSPRLVSTDAKRILAAGNPLPFGGGGEERKKLQAAVAAVEGAEWHRLLALVDEEAEAGREDREVFEYKYWRWRGHWVRYAEGGKEGGEPVVMVHGFGASADQWERVMSRLRRDHRVFAIDKLGFGHSEKPELSYTQYLWERNVEDFCAEVVGRPCFLAGNSIGGYTALGAATALGSARGLVLINSAGRMVSGAAYKEELAAMGGTLRDVMEADGLPPSNAPPQWLLDGAGNLAIALLRSNVEGFCRQVYPTRPDMVDARLVANIIRDSKDPGGYSVLASGAKLPPPRTKNELLAEFRRPLLVAQGLNDPLGGGIAKSRFPLYEEAHPEPGMVRLVGLDAGHCPHHEAPDEVAAAIRSFVSEVVAGGMREEAVAR